MRLLSTMCEQHPVFQPGYRPPPTKPEVEGLAAQARMIPKREGFFDNLESLEGKKARKKGSLSFMSKKDKMQ